MKNAVLGSLLTSFANAQTLLGVISIYTGAPPATPETAVTGTLLGSTATLIAANTTMASAGIAVLSNPLAFTPSATGTAGWARWVNASSAAMIDMDCTASGGGGGLILSTLSLTSGTPASITAASIQMPASLGTVLLNVALRNKLVDTMLQTAVSIGLGQSGSISVYSGAAPATADLAATGTLLETFSTGTAAWNTASGGSASLVTSLVVAATTTGTAGYARWTKGSFTMQLSVSTTTGDIILDNLSLTATSNSTLTNATLSL